MLKQVLSISAVLMVISAHTQVCGGPAVLDEDFSSGIPAGWTVINNEANPLTSSMILKGFTGQWQNYTHLGKKCVANGSQFSNFGNADDFLVTPLLALPTGPLCLSWKASALIPAYYNEPYEVRISTTSPTVSGFLAQPALSSFPSEDGPWTEHALDLSAYAGMSVYVAFRHTAQGYAFFMDDIRVSAPVSRDLAVSAVSTPLVVMPGSYNFSGTITNRGTSTVNSLNLHWSVNNSVPATDVISPVNIAPDSVMNITSTVPWNANLPGTYVLKLWSDNVNGQNDLFAGNDTLTRLIYVQTIPRKPLFEDFTQASCQGCDIANWHADSVLNPYLINNSITTIQYHVAWPGVDPMYSYNPGVGMSRVAQYGIAYVPHGVLDGEELANDCGYFIGSTFCLDSNDVITALVHPSIFELDVNYTIAGDSFYVQVAITAHADVPVNTLHLYTYLLEDTILFAVPPGNNNSQTDFYHTARYALPDTSGEAIPMLTNGQTINFAFSHVVDTANTDPALFRALAFIQDDSTYYLHQSEIFPLFTNPVPLNVNESAAPLPLEAWPNPTDGTVSFDVLSETPATWEIISITGQVVKRGNVAGGQAVCTLDLSDLADGIYTLQVIRNNERGRTRILKY